MCDKIINERIVMPPEKAAEFGQMIIDLVYTHARFDEVTSEQIRDGELANAYISEWQKMKLEYAALTAQRDQLLAACKAARELARVLPGDCDPTEIEELLDAAIAAAKPGDVT